MLSLTPASVLPYRPFETSLLAATSTPLPLVIWHGLGDNYAADGLASVGELANSTNPGTFVYNIRLDEDPGSDRTATFFGNLTLQMQQVCEDLATHPILSTAPAINAIGFSQGGQFLRGYIERCNNPPVRNLVTFGSQHNGIAEFQTCGAMDWLCKGAMALLRTNTWSQYVQSHLVPAQYYRTCNVSTGEPTDEYLEYSNFLADINNERKTKNSTYAENLASLEKFVMFVFKDDTTVIPKESGWFAQVTNLTSGEVTPLRERSIYKEDWVGLRKLDDKGALVFREAEGGHMQLSEELLVEVFKSYFGPVKDLPNGFKVQEAESNLMEL
ncbi:alpha/beta-hydrolase [Lepidopterella palustris CBS 459.81]|uniref:Palmitoyl-protein thioesterase 1 n=1 Tax=Lepidopterella palustris CBS 459.81 TaxID=1314670 RepID=A0A8E2EGD2_9PEZI|nr:alpha/beta-hydrolase [Lepidopterella palustris CBS 459.81]